jgi:4-amino-4-deoxy-L-arabinose transferase-like glycosyltransferase
VLASPGRLFAAAAGLTLAFRFWLAAVTPITGDEAYFIWWGKFPDWGFYDHPPMIGWWLAGLLAVSDAEWWLRLPQIIQPMLLGIAVRRAWPRLWPEQRDCRDWVALLVLLAPVNVWNVFVTTDTPLVYFAVLSGLAWLQASRNHDLRWYAVAGVLLAGAVLSKYFAALLGFAYLVDVLRRRTPSAFAGLAIVFAATVPALLLMAWWNS